jgi:Flp pilus assembly pilin Flp
MLMNFLRKLQVRFTERGQTMTEYALVLAAIAVVAFLTYQKLGNGITNLLNNVVTDLGPS